MLAAESFGLFRDIEIYRNGKNDHENCDDILAELINNKVYYNQEHQQIPVNSIDVFNNKTQGFPHHIYLLGIACLIESRFPKYAAIEGDVSIGQMKKAIDRSEEHTSELQSRGHLVCRLLREKKKNRLTKH